MNKYVHMMAACALASVLSACGGGGGGGTTPPPEGPSYKTLTSQTGTSALTGVALEQNNLSVQSVSGSLSHESGAVNLAGTGDFTGGEKLDTDRNPFTGTYDYVEWFHQDYGDNRALSGVYGIVTQEADMPSSGTATYNGEASGRVIYGNNQGFELTGDSQVEVNFGTKKVTQVKMDGFAATPLTTGSVDTPFDTVIARDMDINGNAFSGGTVTMQKDGTDVSPLGAANTSTAGRFYGYDSTKSIPDEVAGVVSVTSTADKGSFSGSFIAD